MPNNTNNFSPYFWMLWIVITVLIITGAAFYIIASYSIPDSDNRISNSTFEAITSDNQSISGNIQIPELITRSDNGNSNNSFDLAIISGLLAGFSLTLVVSIKQNRYPRYLRSSLLLQGVFYILATLAFIVFGFYFAADKARLLNNLTQLVPVYVISFYAGTILLASGVALSIWCLLLLFIKKRRNFSKLFKQAIKGE